MSINETLLQKVKQIVDNQVATSADLKELKKLIIGNGKVGLAEQVRSNTKTLDNVRKFTWIFITGGISQIVAVIALIITIINLMK